MRRQAHFALGWFVFFGVFLLILGDRSNRPLVEALEASNSLLSFTPALPRAIPDTVRPTPTHTVNVTTAAQLQSALDTTTCGGEIVLTAGTTYNQTGGFDLDPRCSSGWIIVRGPTAVTAANRVDTTVNHPVVTSSNPQGTFTATQNGRYGFRFEDFEITNQVNPAFDLFRIHNASAAVTPSTFVFDRMYMHGLDTAATIRRCLLGNGDSIAVMRSALVYCQETGSDSQAFASWTAHGVHLLYRNLLIGASENVIYGGASTPNDALQPRDITIAQNHFYKPPFWFNSLKWDVKNSLELKTGEYVHVWGNVFQNNWADAQSGYMILLKSTNSGQNGSFYVTSNVFFERNILDDTPCGINLHPLTPGPGVRMHHVYIDNNWLRNIGAQSTWPSAGGCGNRNILNQGTDTLTITRTRSMNPNAHTVIEVSGAGSGFQMTNNLFEGPTSFGIRIRPIDQWYPNVVFSGNYAIGENGSGYAGEQGWSRPSSEPVGGGSTIGADTSEIKLATDCVPAGNFATCAGSPPTPTADVSVTKTGPDSVGTSDNFWYVITTTNFGPDSAKTVVVIDSLPGAVTYVQSSRSGSHLSGVVTWPSVDLAPGASLVDSVEVTAPGTGQIVIDTAAVTVTTADPDAADRLTTKTTLVAAGSGPPPSVGDTIYASSMDAFSDILTPRIGSGLGGSQYGGTFQNGGFEATIAGERVVFPNSFITLDSGTVVFQYVPFYNSNSDSRADILGITVWNGTGLKYFHQGQPNLFAMDVRVWPAEGGIYEQRASLGQYVPWNANDTVEVRIAWDRKDAPNFARLWLDNCQVNLSSTALSTFGPQGTGTDSVEVGGRPTPTNYSGNGRVQDLYVLSRDVAPSGSCLGVQPPLPPTYTDSVWISQHTFRARVFGGFPFPGFRQDSMPDCTFTMVPKNLPYAAGDTFLIRSKCSPPVVSLDTLQVDSLIADWGVARVNLGALRNTPIGN